MKDANGLSHCAEAGGHEEHRQRDAQPTRVVKSPPNTYLCTNDAPLGESVGLSPRRTFPVKRHSQRSGTQTYHTSAMPLKGLAAVTFPRNGGPGVCAWS